MKKTKFQKITSFVLALVIVLGSGVMVVGAKNASVSDTTTSDIKDLLNAISYSNYIVNHADVPYATEDVVLDATQGFTYVTKGGEAPAADADPSSVAHVDTYGDRLGR